MLWVKRVDAHDQQSTCCLSGEVPDQLWGFAIEDSAELCYDDAMHYATTFGGLSRFLYTSSAPHMDSPFNS